MANYSPTAAAKRTGREILAPMNEKGPAVNVTRGALIRPVFEVEKSISLTSR